MLDKLLDPTMTRPTGTAVTSTRQYSARAMPVRSASLSLSTNHLNGAESPSRMVSGLERVATIWATKGNAMTCRSDLVRS